MSDKNVYLTQEEFERALAEKAQTAEENLRSYLEKDFDAPDMILDALNYSLFAKSKRIRPVLTREVANVLGYDENRVAPLADALEMIHTYSLIHDDLPAMDNDDYRRGQLTNHKKYGEDIAILAGDALLNMAMERALNGVPKKDPENYIEAMKMLFYLSGVNGMIGGQTADILYPLSDITGEQLKYIHKHKTGALINAAVLCGAVPFIGIKDPRLHNLFRFSDALGLLFQIQDDILDVEGNSEEMGKLVGSDEKNDKATYVSLYGIASAYEKKDELASTAHEALDSLGGDTRFLHELIDFVSNRTN